MRKKKIIFFMTALILFMSISCKNPVTEQPDGSNSLKEISSFSFEGLSPAAAGTIEDQIITVIVPDGTDVTPLVASFSTTGNSVSIGDDLQVSGVTSNDFSPRITYSVSFDDGSVWDYEVLVYYPPIDITELKQKIADGDDLANVNTSEITDMSSLFYDNATFNQNISSWSDHVAESISHEKVLLWRLPSCYRKPPLCQLECLIALITKKYTESDISGSVL